METKYNTMRIETIPEFKFNNVEDVKAFFKWCVENTIMLHPDDDFEWVIDFALDNDEDPVITTEQAEVLNGYMDKCFEVCERDGADIYELAGWNFFNL